MTLVLLEWRLHFIFSYPNFSEARINTMPTMAMVVIIESLLVFLFEKTDEEDRVHILV